MEEGNSGVAACAFTWAHSTALRAEWWRLRRGSLPGASPQAGMLSGLWPLGTLEAVRHVGECRRETNPGAPLRRVLCG